MRALTTILLLAFTISVSAQQDHLSTVFWNNYATINPAVSGLYYKHQAHAQYRNQWDKVNGAPNTISVGYNAKIDVINSGLGFTYVHDAIGFLRGHHVNLNYSYHIKLGEKSTLAAGISAGIVDMKIKGNWITPSHPIEKDQSLSKNRGMAFVMNAGLVFKRERLNIGFSSTQLNQPPIKTIYFSYARHYNLFADYLFDLSPDFSLKPQVLLRTDAVKFSGDFNLLAIYKKQFWLGATYRTSDAICFMAGCDIKEKFRIGYAYDLTINQLNSIPRGSHEIVLGFMLN